MDKKQFQSISDIANLLRQRDRMGYYTYTMSQSDKDNTLNQYDYNKILDSKLLQDHSYSQYPPSLKHNHQHSFKNIEPQIQTFRNNQQHNSSYETKQIINKKTHRLQSLNSNILCSQDQLSMLNPVSPINAKYQGKYQNIPQSIEQEIQQFSHPLIHLSNISTSFPFTSLNFILSPFNFNLNHPFNQTIDLLYKQQQNIQVQGMVDGKVVSTGYIVYQNIEESYRKGRGREVVGMRMQGRWQRVVVDLSFGNVPLGQQYPIFIHLTLPSQYPSSSFYIVLKSLSNQYITQLQISSQPIKVLMKINYLAQRLILVIKEREKGQEVGQGEVYLKEGKYLIANSDGIYLGLVNLRVVQPDCCKLQTKDKQQSQSQVHQSKDGQSQLDKQGNEDEAKQSIISKEILDVQQKDIISEQKEQVSKKQGVLQRVHRQMKNPTLQIEQNCLKSYSDILSSLQQLQNSLLSKEYKL